MSAQNLERLVVEADRLVDGLAGVWTAAFFTGDVPAMQRARRVRDAAWARRNRRQMAWSQAVGQRRERLYLEADALMRRLDDAKIDAFLDSDKARQARLYSVYRKALTRQGRRFDAWMDAVKP